MMTTKTEKEAAQISSYRLHAAHRRAKSALQSHSYEEASGVKVLEGVVSVRYTINVIPVSQLGGPTRVFGRSKIWIPEYLSFRRRV